MNSRAMNLHWPAARMGCVLGCLGLFAALRCEAQNLVPNPGFEQTDSCINGIGNLPPGTGPTHWYSAYLTYDHLQSCLPYGAVNGLPMNKFTYQQPFEGNSCVGLFTYHKNGFEEQREWVMVPLLDTLVPGQTYYCSFRANAAFGGNDQYPQIWLASNHVGMLFTTYDRHWYYGDAYPPPLNYAHIEHPQILADTVGWTLVSGSFVADSAYTYLMLGNFFSNANTDTLHFADPNSVFPWYPWGYTLIDAVCVTADPAGCDLGHGVGEGQAEAVVLFPNPAHDQLVVQGCGGAEAQVLDALGRVLWQGRVASDRWVLEVAAWARGAYVLRVQYQEGRGTYKFVLAE